MAEPAQGDRSADAPAISVIIPAYDAEATLGVQLEALSRQVMDEPWEVIVADNGSSDGTARLAQSWADRLPLRVVDASARRGPSAARNIGVDAARSPLLAFCDADDIVADDWLPRVLAALRVDEFVAIGVHRRADYSSPARPEFLEYAMYESTYLPGLVACGASHMAVRAPLYRGAGGFDESLLAGEDHDLCYRLQLEGHPLRAHPEAVVTWQRRSTLGALFRQHYGWGRHESALEHKYAPVRDVLARAVSEGRLAPPDPESIAVRALEEPVARTARARGALGSPRALLDVASRLWSRVSIRTVERLAFRLGRWASSVDTTRPQVDASLAEAYVASRSARP